MAAPWFFFGDSSLMHSVTPRDSVRGLIPGSGWSLWHRPDQQDLIIRNWEWKAHLPRLEAESPELLWAIWTLHGQTLPENDANTEETTVKPGCKTESCWSCLLPGCAWGKLLNSWVMHVCKFISVCTCVTASIICNQKYPNPSSFNPFAHFETQMSNWATDGEKNSTAG